ncbi:hypothetical protein LZG75_12140 [Polynucleobacter sp. IMCC30063]|uniref:hypothetical protein n=1 Tax=Polynucleobacter sp. IMCC30063 TaxID=2907298 RepID=UPI001F2C2C94|nr:hypothetical protein [Polynucleobacter sp. IMCC30063]MCE7506979.1 hypothetical protein [Polynucleobacter sp. IMCC30063]
MNKSNDQISNWILDTVFYRLDVSVLLGFKVLSYKQKDNQLEVEWECYVFEPTSSKEFGLFEIPSGPTRADYFPAGLIYEKTKCNFIFDTKEDCEELGESGYMDDASLEDCESKIFKWDDPALPETILEELFDYNLIGSAGTQIIEHFELYEGGVLNFV